MMSDFDNHEVDRAVDRMRSETKIVRENMKKRVRDSGKAARRLKTYENDVKDLFDSDGVRGLHQLKKKLRETCKMMAKYDLEMTKWSQTYTKCAKNFESKVLIPMGVEREKALQKYEADTATAATLDDADASKKLGKNARDCRERIEILCQTETFVPSVRPKYDIGDKDLESHEFVTFFDEKTKCEEDNEEDSDEEITCQRTTVSIICPLSQTRFVKPMKNKRCKHVVSDASAIQYCRRRERLPCPVAGCNNKNFLYRDLEHDEDMEELVDEAVRRESSRHRLTQRSQATPSFDDF
eukprot:g3898.t1